jgi:hypothetical protein
VESLYSIRLDAAKFLREFPVTIASELEGELLDAQARNIRPK